MDFWRKRDRIDFKPTDTIICWGMTLPKLEGVKILNGVRTGDKLAQAKALVAANIPTITVSTWMELRGKPDLKVWLPRTNDHEGAADLLNPIQPLKAGFFVKKLDLQKEYRIHSFDGKSIRAGVKVPREGFKPFPKDMNPDIWRLGTKFYHPWIRAFDSGWRLDYAGFKSNAKMRKIAHDAVKALKLTFAAVDIGEQLDGSLVVLEVNKAPGIEGGSIEAYAKHILSWSRGTLSGGEED